MTTKAQTHANRQNAQKSTGPRTDQGKTAASQNSIKHGLLARQNVIMSESQDEFDLHRDLLLEELAPATPMQSILADRIVSLSWRLKRTETIHTQTFDALDEHTNNNPLTQLTNRFLPKPLHPTKRAPAKPELDFPLGQVAFKDFSNSRVLDRLIMYERRIESSLYKTMHELQKLKLIKNINTQNESPPDSSPGNSSPRNHSPIHSSTHLPIHSIMLNEPNLKNAQKSVTSFPTSNYGKSHRRRKPKNEPNSNPILPALPALSEAKPSRRERGQAPANPILPKTNTA